MLSGGRVYKDVDIEALQGDSLLQDSIDFLKSLFSINMRLSISLWIWVVMIFPLLVVAAPRKTRPLVARAGNGQANNSDGAAADETQGEDAPKNPYQVNVDECGRGVVKGYRSAVSRSICPS